MVTGELKDCRIGYIKITSFSKGTAIETAKLLKEMNTEKIVIDLYDNPGGMHSELIEMFNLFAPKGPVLNVYINGKKRTYFSSNRNFGRYRIAILVNKNSASAAEAFAGTMKDLNAAVIIGEKTYGKGTLSRLAEEKRRQGIVMSKGVYTTAAGTKVYGIGVMPHFEAGNIREAYETAKTLHCNKFIRK